jgi:two-component system sensor histidine kinase BaeS
VELGTQQSQKLVSNRLPRTTLTTRIVLLTSVVAVIVAVIAGLVSYPLARSAAQSQAQGALARLADVTAASLERGLDNDRPGRPLPRAIVDTLRSERITGYLIEPGAQIPPELDGISLEPLLESNALSTEGEVAGDPVLVEARILQNGGAVVLIQPFTVAGETAVRALVRFAIALVVGLLVAIPIGYLVARRLIRPLRAAREAAHQMASGERDVRLVPEGPVEIAEIAEALNSLNNALVLSEGRQRDFLLSVSHELRTPLTAVRGYGEALADGVIPSADIARTGVTIGAEATRLNQLVTDLLDLARLGAVDFPFELHQVDVRQLVLDAGEVWHSRCGPVDVFFTTLTPEDDVIATTDPIRLRQVIDNLMENALRVTPEGQKIVLELLADAETFTIQVRDSGPGLQPQDAEVAFEPGVLYERYRGVRAVGTGIGLALVGRLSRGLGGSAKVETAPEGGAAFLVKFPISRTMVG